MFVEKFRPSTFDEFYGHDDIVKSIKRQIESKELQHLMFYGNPGVGKTTLALIIAREMYGNNWRNNFYEFNASTDRGIDVIRDKILKIASGSTFGSEVKAKIIFLDEADSLTKDAQTALRRIMEQYSGIAKFIISCNFVDKIIQPLRSRCSVHYFKDFSSDECYGFLKNFVVKKGFRVDDSKIKDISQVANGDLRTALNNLENVLNGGNIEKIDDSDFDIENNDLSYLIEKTYVIPPEVILSKLHQKAVKNQDFVSIVILADFDYRMALSTNKILQAQSLIVRLKEKK